MVCDYMAVAWWREELKVIACLTELNKAYEIVVGEIVACKLRTNGISRKNVELLPFPI